MWSGADRLPALALSILALVSGVALSDGGNARHPKHDLPNTPVINQNGESRLFYDDLVKDRLVAINFVFTRCRMVCPMLGYKFGRLRDLLGPRAGTEVFLISVTTDAPHDNPQRLKAWADQFNAGTGWTQVTGEKQDMDGLLKSLKAFTADKSDHSTLILIGNDATGNWRWIDGASAPQVVLAALSELSAAAP